MFDSIFSPILHWNVPSACCSNTMMTMMQSWQSFVKRLSRQVCFSFLFHFFKYRQLIYHISFCYPFSLYTFSFSFPYFPFFFITFHFLLLSSSFSFSLHVSLLSSFFPSSLILSLIPPTVPPSLPPSPPSLWGDRAITAPAAPLDVSAPRRHRDTHADDGEQQLVTHTQSTCSLNENSSHIISTTKKLVHRKFLSPLTRPVAVRPPVGAPRYPPPPHTVGRGAEEVPGHHQEIRR